MVIDFHVHIFPDGLAERAVGSLAEKSRLTPVVRADKASVCRYMRERGIGRIVCQNIAVSPRTMRSVNDFAIASADDFVIPFGSVHPEGDYLPELDRLKKNGILGLKFHPEYQNFYIDDPKLDGMFRACIARGFVLLFHCGLDLAYTTPQKASAERVARFAKRYPGAKIVCAHLGGFSDFPAVLEHLGGLGLWADTAAAGMEYEQPFAPKVLSAERLKALIEAFGADRVLFATDCPWQSPEAGFRMLELAELTAGEREDVLRRNAERLLGLPAGE